MLVRVCLLCMSWWRARVYNLHGMLNAHTAELAQLNRGVEPHSRPSLAFFVIVFVISAQQAQGDHAGDVRQQVLHYEVLHVSRERKRR